MFILFNVVKKADIIFTKALLSLKPDIIKLNHINIHKTTMKQTQMLGY